VSLTAFDTKTGKKVWTDGSRAKTTVKSMLYPDAPSPGYRDLELDGQIIWAACAWIRWAAMRPSPWSS
jgi:hypothetical protein